MGTVGPIYPHYIERPPPSTPLAPTRYLPMEPPCDEQVLAERGYPAGQTTAERVKAILEHAGFSIPERGIQEA